MSEGKKSDDGGPAFPLNHGVIVNGKQTCIPTNGMTLREYYAGQAMMGLLCYAEAESCGATATAAYAVEHAEALIAALKSPSSLPRCPECGMVLNHCFRDGFGWCENHMEVKIAALKVTP